MGLQVVGAVVGDELAVGDDDDLVADLLHLGEDVAGEDDRVLFAELADQVADLNDLLGVQTHRRLVQDDDGREPQNGLGQAHPLAVALGQVVNEAALHAVQPGHVDDALDLGGPLVLGDVFQPGAEVQVLRHRHVHIHRRLLRQVADALFGLLRLLQDVVAVDDDFALGGGEITGHHVHGGGFASTIWAEKTVDFPFLDGQVQVVHRQVAAIPLDQIPEFYHRGSSFSRGAPAVHWFDRCTVLRES